MRSSNPSGQLWRRRSQPQEYRSALAAQHLDVQILRREVDPRRRDRLQLLKIPLRIEVWGISP